MDEGIIAINYQNTFYNHGNIVQHLENIALCLSSDMRMEKGPALKISGVYPNMKQACKLHTYVTIGSPLSYFVLHENKHL